MNYMSAKEAAELWGLTKRRVQILCSEGRIQGAAKLGTMWSIPADAEKPDDARADRYRPANEGVSPLRSSITAKSHTPQYRMHKYFARRPYNVFNHIIKHYTKKGDVVLDCFCGGGVTVFESAALGRKPIGVDINPLATFITRMQLFNGNPTELAEFYNRFIVTLKKKYSDWYKVVFDDDEGIALWTEWVYTVKCPHCGQTIELSEKQKASNGVYKCPDENCVGHSGVKRVLCKTGDSRPVRVFYRSKKTGKEVYRFVTADNMPVLGTLNFKALLNDLKFRPQFKIPESWDRRYEDKLTEKGIVEYSDFFTLRNYALNCVIFNDILRMRGTTTSTLNEYLYFLFSSSLRYTNNMTRVTDNWEGGKPTAMDKHAFWLPNQYVETNVIDILEKRVKTLVAGCSYSSEILPRTLVEVDNYEDMRLKDSYLVLNRSSTKLPLPDGAVDVIITDPPYGSNVQYAELSSVWNAWYAIYAGLDSYIFKDEEAVVNRKRKAPGAKTEEDYERLLGEVFKEGARVLKPSGYLVFTFNNKNIKVWIAMLKAVATAGFYLPENGVIFQDYIHSYKNTAHLRFTGNIQGDFIYSFKKGKIEVPSYDGKGFKEIINGSIDSTVKKLYRRRREYSTPELYQRLMSDMTGELMKYILWCINNGVAIEDIYEVSNDYLENRLLRSLIYQNGIWSKGGNRNGD